MNLLLFSAADIVAPGRIAVSGRRLEHIRTVHRACVGDAIRLGEVNGRVGQGVIRVLSEEIAEIEYQLEQTPPPKLPLSLILALPRPKMLRRVLRTVAELGAAELHLINSARVEKSYWQTPALSDTSVERYFLEGLEQSRDTVLPGLCCHRLFRPFAEDILPDLIAGKQAMVAHPGPYPLAATHNANSILLAIGPEGGWVPFELELLQRAGCRPVSLGDRTLRFETALPVLTGRLFSKI